MNADYTHLRQLEFRRKIFAWYPTIWMKDPATGARIGFIRERFRGSRGKGLKGLTRAIRLYTDKSQQAELLHIEGKLIGMNVTFMVNDPTTSRQLMAMQHHGLRSIFKRDYWDLFTPDGQTFGAIQETSSTLALARRWCWAIPYVGGLLDLFLIFTSQTFDILALNGGGEPQVAGRLVHRKNPFVVKMSLDMDNMPASVDTEVGVAAATLLAYLDASKTR